MAEVRSHDELPGAFAKTRGGVTGGPALPHKEVRCVFPLYERGLWRVIY